MMRGCYIQNSYIDGRVWRAREREREVHLVFINVKKKNRIKANLDLKRQYPLPGSVGFVSISLLHVPISPPFLTSDPIHHAKPKQSKKSKGTR